MINYKELLASIDELESQGISREITINSLKMAIESVYKKKPYEDTIVEVRIDADKKKIEIDLLKEVVETDEIEDFNENTQIPLDEALEEDPATKVGEMIRFPQDINQIEKKNAKLIKDNFIGYIRQASREITMAAFKDRMGELLIGEVEKVEPNFITLSINSKTTVTLPRSQMIDNETFSTGDRVKLLLNSIGMEKTGPQLKVTRTSEKFVERLMEEEIPEFYQNSINIVGSARRAGERTKVAVVTRDPNIDPVAACIGTGGSKISKVTAQLGKEKIDVIEYHVYPGLFIAEALKPCSVLGVKLDEEKKEAIAVVPNESLKVAIGKKGVNVNLASKLTGWKVSVMEEHLALEQGLEFMPVSEMSTIDHAMLQEKIRNEIIEGQRKQQELLDQQRAQRLAEEQNNGTSESQEYQDNVDDLTKEELEEIDQYVNEQVGAKEEEKAEEVKEEPAPEVKFEDQKVEIKNTSKTSLADLEKLLEEERKKPQVQNQTKKKVQKEEPAPEEVTKPKERPANTMPIYSDEEMEDFEEEEDDRSKYDEDIDYEEFDQYYDDN